MSIGKIKILTFILVVFVYFQGWGQDNIIIKSKVDSTFVGYDIPVDIRLKNGFDADSFRIKVLSLAEVIKIYAPKTNTGFKKQWLDSLASEIEEIDFEISDYGKWQGKGNTVFPSKTKENRLRIRIWDTGQFVILPVYFQNTPAGLDTVYPENIDIYPQIFVLSGLNPQDTVKAIAPINDIIKEKKNWKDFIWLYIIIAAIILIILTLVFIPKIIKNKTEVTNSKKIVEKKIPAHIIALKKLNKLEEEKIWKQGKVKEFQSELTHILREYLENRYGIKALEQTTGEIISALEKINLDKNDISTIQNILQIADMVKFAKAKPEEDINQKFLTETIHFVNKTKEIAEN